jgi:hypothetical protein
MLSVLCSLDWLLEKRTDDCLWDNVLPVAHVMASELIAFSDPEQILIWVRM